MRIPIYVLGFGFVLSIGRFDGADRPATAANYAGEPEHSGDACRGWRPE